MYAIVQTGGKQYRVEKGDVITIERLAAEEGSDVVLDQVLMAVDGENTFIGQPLVPGASVKGKVLENGRSKKIVIFKYKAKKNYRKKQGHRQPFTKLEIVDILLEGAPVAAEAEETLQ